MIELLPISRFDPFSVRAAVAAALETARFTVPSGTFPSVKTTEPAGGTLPEAGFTVAVKTVDALCENVTGLADSVNVVASGGGVTVTVTGDEVEPLNPLLPA